MKTQLKGFPKTFHELLKKSTFWKSKNIIKDQKIGNIFLRKQILIDFPPKELRNIVDEGKKEMKSGIVVGFSIFEDKVGIAIGVSKDLTTKYDAVYLVKIASEILGGKGGGGRKDFAQAGGINSNKIDEAYNKILKKIS